MFILWFTALNLLLSNSVFDEMSENETFVFSKGVLAYLGRRIVEVRS